jgi:hypothetical protein
LLEKAIVGVKMVSRLKKGHSTITKILVSILLSALANPSHILVGFTVVVRLHRYT